jgi:hypothetical protein
VLHSLRPEAAGKRARGRRAAGAAMADFLDALADFDRRRGLWAIRWGGNRTSGAPRIHSFDERINSDVRTRPSVRDLVQSTEPRMTHPGQDPSFATLGAQNDSGYVSSGHHVRPHLRWRRCRPAERGAWSGTPACRATSEVAAWWEDGRAAGGFLINSRSQSRPVPHCGDSVGHGTVPLPGRIIRLDNTAPRR